MTFLCCAFGNLQSCRPRLVCKFSQAGMFWMYWSAQ